MGVRGSNLSRPEPPLQWPKPGTTKNRANFAVSSSLPVVAAVMFERYLTISVYGVEGSTVP
jgi:hypothetical protein